MHLRDRDDTLLERIAPARDEALERGDDVCRNQHGVDRLMRGGRVTAAPQDRDLELVHGGHDRAGHERDSTRWKVIPEMDAERRVHRGGVQDPDRKSTRLNSSHLVISYAVFC